MNDKADLPKLLEGLNILSTITTIRDIHIGVAADTERDVIDNTYDASLLVLFNNKADHDAYQVDPIHDIFRDDYATPLCKKVIVFDSVDQKS